MYANYNQIEQLIRLKDSNYNLFKSTQIRGCYLFSNDINEFTIQCFDSVRQVTNSIQPEKLLFQQLRN